MDPNTGRIYELGADLIGKDAKPGDILIPAELASALSALDREATEEERAATRAKALVAVSEEAAQKARLGERELERRRRRRRGRRGIVGP